MMTSMKLRVREARCVIGWIQLASAAPCQNARGWRESSVELAEHLTETSLGRGSDAGTASRDAFKTSWDVPRSVAIGRHSLLDMDLTSWADELARSLLAEPLPRRWAHSQGVAAKARTLAPILGDDAELLQAAAMLHDIGYAPPIAVTGFHPLDGARYLRDETRRTRSWSVWSPTTPVLCSKPKNADCATNSNGNSRSWTAPISWTR